MVLKTLTKIDIDINKILHQKKKNQDLNNYMPYTFKKIVRDDANFCSTERPFQVLAPLKKKHFWPVFELSLGSLKSVSVFLSTLTHVTSQASLLVHIWQIVHLFFSSFCVLMNFYFH